MESNASMRILQVLPLSVFTIGISAIGIIQDWKDNCETFIRPIGHAGLLFSFIVSAIYGDKLGMTVVFNMSLLLAMNAQINDYISGALYMTSIYVLQDCICSENILMLLALSFVPLSSNLGIIDTFAHCGHVTLLSSTGIVRSSTSFLLASALATAFCVIRSTNRMMSLIGSISAFITFSNSYLRSANHLKTSEQWTTQRLWDCKYGKTTTGLVCLYAFALLYEQASRCKEDILLHSLHIGGILSVVLFIYPQTSARASVMIKFIIVAAAFSDSVFTGLKLNFVDDKFLLIHVLSAIGVAIGICLTTVQMDEKLPIHIEDDIHQRDWIQITRWIGVSFYIIYSFAVYIHELNVFVSFSHIVHICFIIGGISTEAITHHDRLTSDIARILLFSEFIASCISNAYDISNLFKIIILWLCIPFRTTSQKGTLAFDLMNNTN